MKLTIENIDTGKRFKMNESEWDECKKKGLSSKHKVIQSDTPKKEKKVEETKDIFKTEEI